MKLKKFLFKACAILILTVPAGDILAGVVKGFDSRYRGENGACPSINQGNPVNVATGNKFHKFNVYQDSNEFPLDFTVYYNSAYSTNYVDTKYCQSSACLNRRREESTHRFYGLWTHSYSHFAQLNFDRDKGKMIFSVMRPDGAVSYYEGSNFANLVSKTAHTPNSGLIGEQVKLIRSPENCHEVHPLNKRIQDGRYELHTLRLAGKPVDSSCVPGELSIRRQDGIEEIYKFTPNRPLSIPLIVGTPNGSSDIVYSELLVSWNVKLYKIIKNREQHTLDYRYSNDNNRFLEKILVTHTNGQQLVLDIEDVAVDHISRVSRVSLGHFDPNSHAEKLVWKFHYGDVNKMLESIVLDRTYSSAGGFLFESKSIAAFKYAASVRSLFPDTNDDNFRNHHWISNTALTNYFRSLEKNGDEYHYSGHIAGWAYDSRGRAFRSYRGPEYKDVDIMPDFPKPDMTEAYEFSELGEARKGSQIQTHVAVQFDSHHERYVKNHLGKKLTFNFQRHDEDKTPSLQSIVGNQVTNCISGETKYSYYKKDEEGGYDGQIKTVTDAKGFIRSFTYKKNGTGNLRSIQNDMERSRPGEDNKKYSVEYEWTDNNNIKKISYKNLLVEYFYDTLNEVSEIRYTDKLNHIDQLVPSGYENFSLYDGNIRKIKVDRTYKNYPEHPLNPSGLWVKPNLKLDTLIIRGPMDERIGQKSLFKFDDYGQVTALTQNYRPRSGFALTTQYKNYNIWGLPEKIEDPDGVETILKYKTNADGVKLASIKHGDLKEYKFTYHDVYADQLTKIVYPDDSWIEIYYTIDTASSIDGVNFNNSDIDYIQNNLGEKIHYSISRIADDDNPATKEDGFTKSVVQYLNSGAEMIYTATTLTDALGRLYQHISGKDRDEEHILRRSIHQEFNYDAVGNLSVIKELGLNRTIEKKYSYDGLGGLINIDSPLRNANDIVSTELDYDQHGRLEKVVDAEERETSYVYNGFGELVQKKSPDTGLTRYHNYFSGKVGVEVRGVGTDNFEVNRYKYDSLDRPVFIQLNTTESYNIVYDYDENRHGCAGRVISVLYNHRTYGKQKKYIYNGCGPANTSEIALIRNKPGEPSEVSAYKSNDKGQLVAETHSLWSSYFGEILYSYDNVGRVKSISYSDRADFQNTLVLDDIRYLPFSDKPESYNLPVNTARYKADYGVNGLLYLHEYVRNFSGQKLYRQLLSRTQGFFNIDKFTEINSSRSIRESKFEYDHSHRLKSHRRVLLGGGIEAEKNYGYDKVGDIQFTSGPRNSRSFEYSKDRDGNQTIHSDNTSWEFNAIGDLITKKVNGSGHSTLFDSLGRMVHYFATRYVYDVNNQRVRKYNTLTGIETRFAYDEDGRLRGELSFNRGEITNAKSYIYLYDRLVAVVDKSADKTYTIYAVATNHLGAPTALIDPQGEVIWSAVYEPYGKIIGGGQGIEFNIRFPGQYYDKDSGFYYNKARYYDPELGRYLSSDPLGLVDGPNTYAYVHGNPVNFTDPDGLQRRGGGSFNSRNNAKRFRLKKRMKELANNLKRLEKNAKDNAGQKMKNIVTQIESIRKQLHEQFPMKCNNMRCPWDEAITIKPLGCQNPDAKNDDLPEMSPMRTEKNGCVCKDWKINREKMNQNPWIVQMN